MQATVHLAEQVARVRSLGADPRRDPAPARRCWRATSTADRARRRAVRRGQLRRDPGQAAGSELFGHEKGAFTGAVARRVGKFEAAEAARCCSTRSASCVAPAGEAAARAAGARGRPGRRHAPVRVDVRIIAATNRDLEREVQHGTFREDLFYRLNVVHAAACRRCASGRGESRAGRTFRAALRPGKWWAVPAAVARAVLRLLRIRGPAMCASWRTPSSARCCSPATRRSRD